MHIGGYTCLTIFVLLSFVAVGIGVVSSVVATKASLRWLKLLLL